MTAQKYAKNPRSPVSLSEHTPNVWRASRRPWWCGTLVAPRCSGNDRRDRVRRSERGQSLRSSVTVHTSETETVLCAWRGECFWFFFFRGHLSALEYYIREEHSELMLHNELRTTSRMQNAFFARRPGWGSGGGGHTAPCSMADILLPPQTTICGKARAWSCREIAFSACLSPLVVGTCEAVIGEERDYEMDWYLEVAF